MKRPTYFVMDTRNPGGKRLMDDHMQSHKWKLKSIKSTIPSRQRSISSPRTGRAKKGGRKAKYAAGSSRYPAPKVIDTNPPESHKYSRIMSIRKSQARDRQQIEHSVKLAEMFDRINQKRPLHERKKDPMDAIANPVRVIRYTKFDATAEYDYSGSPRKELFITNPYNDEDLVPVSAHSPLSARIPFRSQQPVRPQTARPLSARARAKRPPLSARSATTPRANYQFLSSRRPKSSGGRKRGGSHRPKKPSASSSREKRNSTSNAGASSYENRRQFLAEVKDSMLGEFIESEMEPHLSWIPRSHANSSTHYRPNHKKKCKNSSKQQHRPAEKEAGMRALLRRIEGIEIREGERLSDAIVNELAAELGVDSEPEELLFGNPVLSAVAASKAKGEAGCGGEEDTKGGEEKKKQAEKNPLQMKLQDVDNNQDVDSKMISSPWASCI